MAVSANKMSNPTSFTYIINHNHGFVKKKRAEIPPSDIFSC